MAGTDAQTSSSTDPRSPQGADAPAGQRSFQITTYDHNLGSWRDVPGVYFAYDLPQRLAVIADRGQGVLATLKRVLPELATEQKAVETAFTQTISGRSPEQRGNGLKFVAAVVQDAGFSLEYYSGDGRYTLGKIEPSQHISEPLGGVLAGLRF